ncbi:uncharacterized protein LOC106527709 [Austrofundulus limnaeus]|uniref:Uncharacterized protein LOC106527709 n=1 Tax=Austrofundulus limnaeus TaxID=52670 RepID=A0A2I4CDT2_AUSLI|nr:PREDICTED: uncharacterized protein C6orf226 homolog [Austrofundulus limnaeus]
MESVFVRFESYNFEADQRFAAGLKTLEKSEKSREETEMLNLKLFYYNRFVEPIDQQSYRTWCSSSHHVKASDLQQDQRNLSPSDSENQTETSAHPETKQLSFAEVLQLVQEGKEVPGVTKLDIKPSNQSPTPSQMQQVRKPWETSSS